MLTVEGMRYVARRINSINRPLASGSIRVIDNSTSMAIKKIDTNKLDWTFEATPQLYGKVDGQNKYIVYSEDLGAYSKRDAEMICMFLRHYFPRIIDRAIVE